jgi:hypothetical protein
MQSFRRGVFIMSLALSPAMAASPVVGRWDFTLPGNAALRANWLGVTESNGTLKVMHQPTGGHVRPVVSSKVTGNHLSLVITAATAKEPALTWELDAVGDKITGVQKKGDQTVALTGVRAPELKTPMPKAWSAPQSLFNGKDLTGWKPLGTDASHWVVKDGLLVNEDHGANLVSDGKYMDFKLHFEVASPEHANSGFYLRGRYEIQIERGEPNEPPERAMGSIYGRIAPAADAPKKGEFDVFDVTLVGRTLTVVRNGVTTINAKELEGITGGALDANEGEPGPFYIQGDHTGGLKFRNITVSVPK